MERYANNPIKPIEDDIVIAKLRPGQSIDLKIFCTKGTGFEHAKWSPVGKFAKMRSIAFFQYLTHDSATATYRLMPDIKILKPIEGSDAEKFAKCFPAGVVKVVEENGKKIAKVVCPRKDTVSRECLRHKEFEGKVILGRVKNHFICKCNVDYCAVV